MEFDINIKENKRSKITRERQMLLIRTGKYELCLWLDDILQAVYKFKKWRLHYLSELYSLISSTIVSWYVLRFWCCRRFVALLVFVLAIQTTIIYSTKLGFLFRLTPASFTFNIMLYFLRSIILGSHTFFIY